MVGAPSVCVQCVVGAVTMMWPVAKRPTEPDAMQCDALRHTTTQPSTTKRRETLSPEAGRERDRRGLVKASRDEMSLRGTGTRLKRSVRNERGANEFRALKSRCVSV